MRFVFALFYIFLTIMPCQAAVSPAQASNNGADAMAYVAQTASESTKALGDQLVVYGEGLFFALAIISVVMSFAQIALQSDQLDLNVITVQLLRMIMLVGFVAWLLHNSGPLLASLISDFTEYGNEIAKTGFSITNPSKFFDMGWEKAWAIWDATEFNSDEMIASTIKLIITFFAVLFVCCQLVSIAMTMLLVSLFFYYLAYGGLFFLGFFGINYTKDFAINYLKALFANAVRYYAMIVLCNILCMIFSTYVSITNFIPAEANYGPVLSLCLIIYVMNKIATQIPQMIAELISRVTIQSPLTSSQVAVTALNTAGALGLLSVGTVAITSPFVPKTFRLARATLKGSYSALRSVSRTVNQKLNKKIFSQWSKK